MGRSALSSLKTFQGLKFYSLMHLQSFASKIFFSTSNLLRPLANSFHLLGGMDDSNLQTFASGYFSHLQSIKIIHIFWVCKRKFQ